MSEIVAARQVTIANPHGLHARPADLFARLASRFGATIDLIKDGQRANGKSILDILMLAATWGTALTIEARGGDAREAVDALSRLIERDTPTEETAGAAEEMVVPDEQPAVIAEQQAQ